MRHLVLAVLLITACKKSDPAKSEPAKSPEAVKAAEPAPAPAAPAPAPTPAPPPAPKDPTDAALEAATAVFNAVAPITKEWGDEGSSCAKGIPEIDKVLDGMKMQVAIVQEAKKMPEVAKQFYAKYFSQGDSPFHDAKSAALGAALHCPALVSRIEVAMGIPQPVDPKAKKK
jgi:hypothetical protein